MMENYTHLFYRKKIHRKKLTFIQTNLITIRTNIILCYSLLHSEYKTVFMFLL